MRRLGRLWPALALLAVLAGCVHAPAPRSAPSAAAPPEEVVREYDRLLPVAFERRDMNVLAAAATRRQAQEEYYQMAALAEGKLKLVATLRSLSLGRVAYTSETSATLQAHEVWDYDQVSTETSRVVRSERGVAYDLRYDLVLTDGRWFVDGVRSVDSSGSR